MFNHDAWMRRGVERQELLRELESMVAKKSDTCPEFDYQLAKVIFHYLATVLELEKSPLARPRTKAQKDAQTLFKRRILPKIGRFSSDKPEQYKVMADLLKRVNSSIIGQFVSIYSIWESVTFGTRRK